MTMDNTPPYNNNNPNNNFNMHQLQQLHQYLQSFEPSPAPPPQQQQRAPSFQPQPQVPMQQAQFLFYHPQQSQSHAVPAYFAPTPATLPPSQPQHTFLNLPDAQSLQFLPFHNFIPPVQHMSQIHSSVHQQQQQQQPQQQQQQPLQIHIHQPVPAAQQHHIPTQTPPPSNTTTFIQQTPHVLAHQHQIQLQKEKTGNQKRKPGAPGTRAPKENQRYIVVSEDLLRMRQGDAAERLNMKPSTLSKRWKNSLPDRSWPYRTNQKLDKQMKKLKELQLKGYDVASDLRKIAQAKEENLRPALIIVSDKAESKVKSNQSNAATTKLQVGGAATTTTTTATTTGDTTAQTTGQATSKAASQEASDGSVNPQAPGYREKEVVLPQEGDEEEEEEDYEEEEDGDGGDEEYEEDGEEDGEEDPSSGDDS